MKNGIAILAGILFVTVSPAMPASASQMFYAGPAPRAAKAEVTPPITDFSAAKRKKNVVTTPSAALAPPLAMWTGADPTRGPGIERLREAQRSGRCVIDEGYGRFTYCSSH